MATDPAAAMEVSLERRTHPVGDDLAVEIVERKGLGHPDTICDILADRLSNALSRYYVEHCGAVLHHNVDKALLWAGAARPAFGGGEVLAPMELYLAGRAAIEVAGVSVPLAELAEDATRSWLSANVHALDAARDFRLHTLVRPGSAELVDLFLARQRTGAVLANDTSCGVGFAPLSSLERIVIAAETCLNGPRIRAEMPAIGEDVKVMGVRHGDAIRLTVGCAVIGRFVDDMDGYRAVKRAVAELVTAEAARFTTLPVSVEVNAGDDLDRDQIYLTVTGTSAEAGDDGQAGRGNRANGLITPCRPMTIESVAGKNPVTHVGKLYSIAAQRIADALVADVEPVAGADCYLVSRIGHPIGEPQLVNLRVATIDDVPTAELREEAEAVVADHLAGISRLWQELIESESVVY
jgi:S-adenosylmethionine synthetase